MATDNRKIMVQLSVFHRASLSLVCNLSSTCPPREQVQARRTTAGYSSCVARSGPDSNRKHVRKPRQAGVYVVCEPERLDDRRHVQPPRVAWESVSHPITGENGPMGIYSDAWEASQDGERRGGKYKVRGRKGKRKV